MNSSSIQARKVTSATLRNHADEWKPQMNADERKEWNGYAGSELRFPRSEISALARFLSSLCLSACICGSIDSPGFLL
jgi:hypothetical protein